MLVVRKQFRPALNPFSMSFLDTVSAGFGAAFFLFIIFASLPVEKASGMLGSEEYVQVELEWNSKNYNLELIVDPPGPNRKPVRIFLHDNTLIISAITGEIANLPGRESWQQAFIDGASAYGQSRAKLVKSEFTGGYDQRISFRAIGTCPGEWKFYVAVKSKKNYLTHPGFVPFTVSGRAFTSRVDSVGTQYRVELDLLKDTYLPPSAELGHSRGGLLLWSGGPDGANDESHLTINENPHETMEYCG